MNTEIKFKERLKELRLKNGKKQSDIADFLNVSMQSYSAYENGREPNYTLLCKLADYYNVTTDYLLGRDVEAPVDNDSVEECAERLQEILNFHHEEAMRCIREQLTWTMQKRFKNVKALNLWE